MSLEVFQLLDNEPIDNSIIKRDLQTYTVDEEINYEQSDQNIGFFCGKNNYHQIGNAYLEFDLQYGTMMIRIFNMMMLFVW